MIDFLREEYFENNESTPNTRAIIKAMSDKWGERVEQKTLYDLFPLDPSKTGRQPPASPKAAARGAIDRRAGKRSALGMRFSAPPPSGGADDTKCGLTSYSNYA